MVEIKIEKSLLKVLAVIVIAVIAGVVWAKRTEAPAPRVAISEPATSQSSAPPVAQPTTTASGLTKENSGGDVTVSITPVVAGEAELGFDVAINTHSVDMSAFDPKKQIILQGADDNDVLPSLVTVEGSGHHQQLQVAFPKVAKPWKLVVRDVGGVPAREFNW